MKFVNRLAEMARLDALVARRGGGLAAVWGRRRVGKTRLLLEWSRAHGGMYSVADLSAGTVQRRYLAEAVAARFAGFGDAAYPDWRSLLRALAREAARAGWRGPLILDEFPYLVEMSSALPSVLQAFVDGEGKDAGLVVAIAGSSQAMMHGMMLQQDSPLYGRAAVAMGLPPMSVGALAEALRLDAAPAAVRAFAAWGGIPRYWELAEPFGTALDEAVDALVLDPLGPLHQEPDRLLAEERPAAVALRPILDAIGAGAHRVSEIGGRVGQPATALSRGLSRLVDLGLVTRETPFGDPERGAKRSLYRIADPFFRLWFRVVAPRRALLAMAPTEARRAVWTEHRSRLFAEAWEGLCREAVPRLAPRNGALAAAGPWGVAARYWQAGGPEWDVVARSLDGASLLLGEVKWHAGEASDDLVETAWRELKAKGRPALPGPTPRQVVHAVFVPECSARWRRRGGAVAVVEASGVVAALR
jgi:hypothetical protein